MRITIPRIPTADFFYLFLSLMNVIWDARCRGNSNNATAPSESPVSDEVRLLNYLLSRYDRMGTIARPLYNSSQIMMVQFGMRLIQMDIIEKEQLLKTSVWVRCRWIDEYLRWNPEDYGGIKQTVVPWNKVWTPDIVIVNTASTSVDERVADIMVTYQGAVFWSPQRMFQSACLLDVTNFPYDRHTCHMWFQSMARYSWQLDIWPYGHSPWDLETYLASFKKSQEWEIMRNFTERYEKSRDVGVLLKFSRRVALRFTLTVQRRLGYTCHLLMMPCVFLGCMTLVVFCLPPERPDRHTLATSLFGSFIVLTLILVEVAPPNSASIPKLGMYYACNMTLVMISIFLSGLVINVSRRGDRRQRVPWLLKIILIDVMSRLLLCHRRVSYSFRNYKNERASGVDAMEIGRLDVNGLSSEGRDDLRDGGGVADSLLSERIRRLEAAVKGEYRNNFDLCRARWSDLAVVLDRFFLLCYFFALTISLGVLFPRPERGQYTSE